MPGLKNNSHQSKGMSEKWGQKKQHDLRFHFFCPHFSAGDGCQITDWNQTENYWEACQRLFEK